MKSAIFGAGALGLLFAGRLYEAGQEVAIIARGPALAKIKDEGIHLLGANESGATSLVPATDAPSEVGPVDLIILCVKAWQVPEAAKAMAPMVGENTLILTTQNGVEAPGQVAAVHGWHKVLAGICRIISVREELNSARIADFRQTVLFRNMDPDSDGRAPAVADMLQAADFDVMVVEDIQKALWEKFAFITVFGGTGAFYCQGIGDIRSHPERRVLMEKMLAEIRAVGLAHGVNLGPELISESMGLIDRVPHDSTASMCRDLLQGRPSELETQCGTVVRLAQEKDVAAPLNAKIYQALLPLEQAARARQG